MKLRRGMVRRAGVVCLVLLMTGLLFLQAHLEARRASAQTAPTITLPFPPDPHMSIAQGWLYNYNSGVPVCQGDPYKHCGIDYVYVDSNGTWQSFPVLADAPGTVYRVDGGDCGNGIQINSGGLQTLYCHLSGNTFRVTNGATVNRGDLVGWAGSSGDRNPPLHLHMQIKINGNLTDPYGIWQTADAYPSPNSSNSSLKYFNPGPCDGGEGVYLYEDTQFSGRCQKFTADSADWVTWYVGNDAVSSLRMVGSWSATLYQNSSYMGASTTFNGDQRDFRSLSGGVGNDSTSSIRVARRSGGNGSGGGGAPSNCQFGGQPIAFGQTVSSFITDSTDRVIYCFQATGGTQATIRMWAHQSNLDTIVKLYNRDGYYITENDDSDGTTNSRLSVGLPDTGLYYLVATSYGGTRGQFWLSVNR